MAGKTLSYFNLTGGLNTVQTMATINSTPNRTESPEMVNVEYFKLSGLRTMNGNVALNGGKSLNSKIEFGYEYIQGNDRYMIVADKNTIYEYEPVTDTFKPIYTFRRSDNTIINALDNAYITICGYANGIVAAMPNSDANYMIYYRKGRKVLMGAIDTTDATDTFTLPSSANVEALEIGDYILIGENIIPYEIIDRTVTNDRITFRVQNQIEPNLSGAEVYLSEYTKIFCKAEYDVSYSDITLTNFVPSIVQSHQGRLWVAAKPDGYNTTSVVIYSDLGSIHDAFKGGDNSVYAGGYFEEFWEDTSDITAIGTWDKYVVVHKREHTYLINTSNSDATQWNVESYSEYTCDNQRGFVKANNGYYTYCTSGGGIYPMIQRTIYSAITQGVEASTKIRDTFANLNQYRLDEIFAVYHPIKKYLMFYMPMIGEEGSKDCYILDLQTKSWLHRKVPQSVSCAFEFDNKVYIGTYDGKIYEEFRGYTFDGEPINFSWKSPWFIWGNGTNWTTTREIRVKMSQEGTNNFYIRNRRDGNEEYKQRTITNTSTATNNLMWDERILAGDISRGYTQWIPVYKYGINNTTYYSLDDVLNENSILFTFNGTPNQNDINSMAHFSNGTIASTITGEFESYEGVSATATNADKIIAGTSPVYAYTWRGTTARYLCYRSSQDSNIKIWVDRNNTSQGVINLEKKQSTQYYAFYGVGYNYQPNGNIIATTSQYVNAVTNGTTQTGIPFYYKNGGNWVRTTVYGNQNLNIYSNDKTNYGSLGAGYGVAGCSKINNQWYPFGTTLSYSLIQSRGLKLNRATQYDTGGTYLGWNGLSNRSGIDISGQFTYNNNTVTYNGVTYNRYATGDEGSEPSGEILTVYSSKSPLAVGDTVYIQDDLQTPYGEVEVVSGTNYTINARTFTPNNELTNWGTDAKYYFIRPLLESSYGSSGIEEDTLKLEQYYPKETNTDTEKMLTDSRWDGNEEFTIEGITYIASENDPNQYYTKPDTQSTWVNTGQITKRFPIDRQYFQTLQLEFCGEADNQGIELYGFEVDGIQLTEVPY